MVVLCLFVCVTLQCYANVAILGKKTLRTLSAKIMKKLRLNAPPSPVEALRKG